jgi:hypothetical protein
MVLRQHDVFPGENAMASNHQQEQDALAQVMRADEEEARREMWWKLMPTVERGRALALAGLDRARADDDLASLSVRERERIHTALNRHIIHMETLRHCCGILVERRPVVAPGAVTRLAELEQQQAETKRQRDEFARLQQEQEQEQQQGRNGSLH